MHILIAEDDNVTRRMLQRTLENWGHTVTATQNGDDAWQAFLELDVRLIITDWIMPGMDGLELCQRIRTHTTGSSHPVYIMLLTSRGSVQDLAAGLNAGADDFISKPFSQDELRARVQAGERIVALQQELIRAREEMERLALTDSLTDMFNRRALIEIMRKDEDRCRRQGKPISLVLGDIDNFKWINDTYGHQTGDRILKMVSQCLRASIRTGDHAGRWGGEEFVLVLPGADIIQSAEIAERCRALLEAQRITLSDGSVLKMTASFGAACTEGLHRTDIMTLVQEADKAMYWAKDSGRNRVKIYISSADQEFRKAG
ncbi:MAG: diguanylate cyclase [Planctomycetota bacterium]|jgi:two-component system cell cycle response regulator|nr:diguanylate cyclase [Planctomycetota bacterium]